MRIQKELTFKWAFQDLNNDQPTIIDVIGKNNYNSMFAVASKVRTANVNNKDLNNNYKYQYLFRWFHTMTT